MAMPKSLSIGGPEIIRLASFSQEVSHLKGGAGVVAAQVEPPPAGHPMGAPMPAGPVPPSPEDIDITGLD